VATLVVGVPAAVIFAATSSHHRGAGPGAGGAIGADGSPSRGTSAPVSPTTTTSTTSTTSPSSPASPAPPAVRTFDIVASGDILPYPSIAQVALAEGNGTYDFRSMFAPLRPLISHAALSICQIDAPLTDQPPTMSPTFSAPIEVAAAVAWAGWDVCSTASNHTLDQHQTGVDSTLAALDAAGVRHTGSAASAQQATRIQILDAAGVRVAVLAYTNGTNGIPPPAAWTVNMMSFDRIQTDARRARSLGAELVIVNLHWGTFYVHEPDPEQTALANRLLRQHVVDAIVGEHAHVVQPIHQIAGRFVSYGQGNLLASQYPFAGLPIDTMDGMVTVLHVRAVGDRAAITGADYVPTLIQRPSFRILPVGAMLQRLVAQGQGNSVLAQELRASYERTVASVGTGPSTHPVPASIR
jgi:poly-gamma-glutamate synthesis protein (capsule biosynthesis protein)